MIKPRFRPIIFNSDMVRAILDGRKTVTRRILKVQPKMKLCYTAMGSHNVGLWTYPSPEAYKYWGDEWRLADGITSEDREKTWIPPCHTDDVLYVRETWARHGNPKAGRPMHYDYKADRDDPRLWDNGFIAEWESPVRMPKEAARLFLKVTNVSVERLQDITMDQIAREGAVPSCRMCSFNSGIEQHEICCTKHIERAAACKLEMMFPDTGYSGLWDSSLKKADVPAYGWNANPYVWVIEFERCEKPEEM